jgi:hypothetical protein
MLTLVQKLTELQKEIFKNRQKFKIINLDFGQSLSSSELLLLEDISLSKEFYLDKDDFFRFKLSWKLADDDSSIMFRGNIKILPIAEIFRDWKGILYFEDTPIDSDRRDFKIVDYFLNEYACGVYWGNKKDLTFYYAELDGSKPKSLDLDINGYIEMMILSKGYLHWQMAITDILYGDGLANVDEFKEEMPKLFPGWTWEAFVQKFEEVRLHSV